LVGTNQQGNNYDRFRGRVIFPILNSSGKTIAFGGRDLKGGPAKYINSPETEIYVKNKELYGIFQARPSIVRENKCYLVEGYLDVIGMWQSGVRNVVASSGTALTDGQISLIHRFTPNVTLIYDGDPAGIKASLRGIDMFLDHNMNIKAVPLPPGDDPDSLAAKLTPEQLKNYLSENEIDIIQFKSKVLLEDAKGDPQKRWEAIRSIVESIAHIADKIKRDVYIKECSQLLDIAETTLSSEIAKARTSIIEKERIKRRINDVNRQFPENGDPKQNETSSRAVTHNSSPLFPLEKEVIINCIKYGFMRLWDEEMDETPGIYQTVFEYIDEELAIDNITFTDSLNLKVFETLRNLVPHFKTDLSEFRKTLEARIDEKRKEGYDEIAVKSLSMAGIEKEQTRLENQLSQLKVSETEEFSKNYIADKLGSHEDGDIRAITLEACAEKHHLSNLFSRNLKQESSEEKILPIVINSLNVLKNGIIDTELKKLMEELKNISDNTPEKEKELHRRISGILQLRSRMAKDIGDRIVCPTPKR
ncbi:MAG: toprim domain-containing protein, partial [Muribaculaceae bacterium]|nr:toprim domain-containing protein [Muribaculaceae bacterium]